MASVMKGIPMSEKRDNTFEDLRLEDLSVAELEEVRGRAATLISEKSVAEKAALRGDIEDLLDEHGFKLVDVFEELAPKRRGRRPAVAAQDSAIGNGHDASNE